jgi:hypothetical protein
MLQVIKHLDLSRSGAFLSHDVPICSPQAVISGIVELSAIN